MRIRNGRTLAAITMIALVSSRAPPALAASAREISRDSNAALSRLYKEEPAAKTLAGIAKGILVFPSIVKAGFIVGGQLGDGALLKDGKTVAYYGSLAGSYGLQAGAQSFSYVLMFMEDASLGYLDKTDGWEIGVGPSVVIVDKGMAHSLTTTTLQKGVYAFIFGQKGLMAGVGLQGSKITRIHPE